jgi:DNA polymerase I-like protein with 3'-5' exonuclease and polymerase domains
MSLFHDLHEKGLWRGYERHIVQLNPVLERMSMRGMPVDPDQFKVVTDTITNDFRAEKEKMQSLVPLELKVKKVYKKPRKDGVQERVLEWTPSPKNLFAYMRFRKHPIPKKIKGNKDTTEAIGIQRLARSTKDPLYATVIAYRKAQTILKNHVKNWAPGPDGRVHTTFYFDPATGQLSSRRPNVQNAPAHDDPEFGGYAKVFRSMVKPPSGKVIVEFDYRAFHVQTLGFEARDLDMMRMGRLDIHSFVTANFLKLPGADRLPELDDDELRDRLARVKKDHKYTRDAQCKHALLGYNNGMGWKKLYLQYREFFNNQNEAKRAMEVLDELFPASKTYREAIVQQAHDQGYLISRHGYIRYFWEVYRWKNGDWSHGDDHEAALCFFTQNDAHGELKDRMLTLAERGLDERYGLLNCIHDSLIFEVSLELLEECLYTVKEIMQAPSKVLVDSISAPNGLVVEVEAKGGPSWSECKTL